MAQGRADRIQPDEDTMQVNLQLMNGNRVQAVVRTEDEGHIFTTHTIDPDIATR